MQDAPTPAEITRILHEWQAGSREALDRLMPIVYDELRVLASRQLAREWRQDRMQTTAVVSEAYVKLFGQREVDWQNRGHFFAIAAQMMRRILVDHARRRQAAKRDGATYRLQTEPGLEDVDRDPELLALDEALTGLETLDVRQARIVELRFFGGLTVEETAEVTGISPATVKREWQTARAWLAREIRPEN
jgi:RNA polymerase sigma factor (TIGR02999 family)